MLSIYKQADRKLEQNRDKFNQTQKIKVEILTYQWQKDLTFKQKVNASNK